MRPALLKEGTRKHEDLKIRKNSMRGFSCFPHVVFSCSSGVGDIERPGLFLLILAERFSLRSRPNEK